MGSVVALARVLIEVFNLCLVLGHRFGVEGIARFALVAHFVPHGCAVFLVDTGEDRHIEVKAFALLEAEEGTLHRPFVEVVEQLVYFVLIIGVVAAEAEVNVLVANNVVRSLDFHASVAHLAHVVHYGAEARGVGQRGAHEHVLSLAVVQVDVDLQLFKEGGADAHIGLDLLFPSEVGVGELCVTPTRSAVVVGSAGEGEVAVVTYGCVTRATHADLEFEVGKPRYGTHEVFAGNVPRQTAADEDSRAVVLTEAGGCIGAHRYVGGIFCLVVPVGAAEEREELVFRFRLRGGLGRLAVREEHEAVVGNACYAGVEALRIALDAFVTGEERDVVLLGDGELIFRRVRDGPHGAAAE